MEEKDKKKLNKLPILDFLETLMESENDILATIIKEREESKRLHKDITEQRKEILKRLTDNK